MSKTSKKIIDDIADRLAAIESKHHSSNDDDNENNSYRDEAERRGVRYRATKYWDELDLQNYDPEWMNILSENSISWQEMVLHPERRVEPLWQDFIRRHGHSPLFRRTGE